MSAPIVYFEIAGPKRSVWLASWNRLSRARTPACAVSTLETTMWSGRAC